MLDSRLSRRPWSQKNICSFERAERQIEGVVRGEHELPRAIAAVYVGDHLVRKDGVYRAVHLIGQDRLVIADHEIDCHRPLRELGYAGGILPNGPFRTSARTSIVESTRYRETASLSTRIPTMLESTSLKISK